MRARDIMTTPVIAAKPDTSLKSIAVTFLERDISAMPVENDSGDLIGIVSEADLIRLQTRPDSRRRSLLFARGNGHVPHVAREMMSINVVTVAEDEDGANVARLMLRNRLQRVVVVRGKRVTGIIARRDILKILARSDAVIEAELQLRLEDDSLILGRFTAHVAEGVATLSGPADTDARRLATRVSRSVPGVVAVEFDDERSSVRA